MDMPQKKSVTTQQPQVVIVATKLQMTFLTTSLE
jgi:hypothetical protein